MNPFLRHAARCSLTTIGAIGFIYGASHGLAALLGSVLLIVGVLTKLNSSRTAALRSAKQANRFLTLACEREKRRAAILEMVGAHAPLLSILDAVVEFASTAMPGAGAAVWTVDHRKLQLQSAANLPQSFVDTLGSPLAGAASLDPIPLYNAGGLTIGALQLFFPEGSQSAPDEGFVTQLADLATLAIQNRLFYERLTLEVGSSAVAPRLDRLFFEDRLQRAIRLARPNRTKLAVIWIDLDRFRQFTEMLGRQVSEELLDELARRLQSCLRKSDTLARIGGDQFTVLLGSVASANGAQHAVKRMMDSLERPVAICGHEIAITASVGVSVYPEHGEDAIVLMRNADLAMHSAKNSGGNACRTFSQNLGHAMGRRREIARELSHALDRGEFFVEYQPLVHRSGQIQGLEALLRWNSPALGSVSPAEFIPVAEEIGWMPTIGEWVMRAACSDAAQWIREGYAIPHIAVNASSIQFRDKQFAAMVMQALRDFELSPSMLEIEVTESVFINNVLQMTDQIESLRHLGVTFAIDDFGTGYSSLSRLRELPVDFVKIDQSFVKDLRAGGGASNKLVRGMIELAHSLDLQVVAEGVETQEQLTVLGALGCQISQGFFLHRPMPPADVETLLARAGTSPNEDARRPWLPAPVESRAS